MTTTQSLTTYVAGRPSTLARNEQGNFDEEASTLGLGAGQWPGSIEAYGDTGRVQLIRGCLHRDPDGELRAVAYTSWDGLVRLLIWND
jgi:hypothetical protein